MSLLDVEVASAFESACDRLRAAGATLEDVHIPHANSIGPIYLTIVLTEAAAYHARTLDSRADEYTPNVRMRLEMGRYVLAEDYVRALKGRDVLRAEVETALAGRDGLLLPGLAIPAPKIGAATVRIGEAEEPVRNVMLRMTQLFNLTGHPAIAMPCGRTSDGMPVSAQIVGHYARTFDLLRVAGAAEAYLGPGTSR
jgi:aspartyl-tRNA(Asn)/glutamyl-tRNA(Gln) amidotransferase subunit A